MGYKSVDANCKITALDYGDIKAPAMALVAGKPESAPPVVIPVLGWYVVTADGKKVLFDTGCSPDFKKTWGPMADGFPLVRQRFMQDALKDLKVAPGDIDYLIISHLHADHAGGLASFRNSRTKIVIQKKEAQVIMSAVYTDRNDPVYGGFLGSDFQFTDLNWVVVDGDYTLLPGVHLLDLPGHTPGTMGMRVETKNSGNIIISGDSIYIAENFGPPVTLSGSVFNVDDYHRSMAKTDRLAKLYQGKLMFGHEPNQTRPMFPVWWN